MLAELTLTHVITIGLFLLTHLGSLIFLAFKMANKVNMALAHISTHAKVMQDHAKQDDDRYERINDLLNRSMTYANTKHQYALEAIDKQHRVAIDGIHAANASSKERFDLTMSAIDKLATNTDTTISRVYSDLAEVRRRQG